MTYIILQTPQKHECRHKQQHSSTWTQNPSLLTEPGEIVVHVLNHIERGYQIECAVCVRKLFTRAESYFFESTLTTESKCIFRNINTLCLAILRQHHQVRTRSTTDVENPRTPIGHLPANLFHESGEDLAPSDVPPMRLFHAKQNRIAMLHHLARKRTRNS